jgi:predicted dehydrogenase
MKRRQFIGNLLKAGGGVIIASNFTSIFASVKSSRADGKLGVALVGLGSYSTYQLAPALRETKHCYLAGIVTGTPSKEEPWAKQYNIPQSNIYNYKNFDNIANNKDIDIVYVVLPNSMHAEFTIRAAQAGKHVISEKPMATSVEDCQKMIDACKKAGKKLSIGYRLYYDPYNRKMMEMGQHQKYGKLLQLSSGNGFTLRDPNAWRINKQLAGGGPLMDMGIYSLEGCIYTVGELPTQVTAKDTTRRKEFFKDVEGSLEWEMLFPSGLRSQCQTSYEDNMGYLKATAERGSFEFSPAFYYSGIHAKTPDGPLDFPPVNQQALQMDAFAQCIQLNRDSIVPGELGKRDVYIMKKIYEAAATGKPVMLKDIPDYLYKI